MNVYLVIYQLSPQPIAMWSVGISILDAQWTSQLHLVHAQHLIPPKGPLNKKLLFLTVGMFVDIDCVGWILDTCIN